MKNLFNLFMLLTLVFLFSTGVASGDSYRSKTSVRTSVSRPSTAQRQTSFGRTTVSPYGRSSYIQRSYGKGGALQSTRTIVPYGNGWLIR